MSGRARAFGESCSFRQFEIVISGITYTDDATASQLT